MRHAALAAVLLVIFLGSTLWVRNAIGHSADTQRRLQNAEVERGRLLRLQLDEETGIRGYIVARSRIYLQPYDSARRTFGASYRSLVGTLTALGLNDEPARREALINQAWLKSVALPALSGAHVSQNQAQRLGKELVDAFRASDARLAAEIEGRARSAETSTNALVSKTLFGSIALGVLIIFVVTAYGLAQSRLSRRLEKESRSVEVLQNAFLGPELPSFPNIALHGAYAPARDETRVGGDWYEAYPIGDGQLLLAIGDVSGHGLEAAVMMSRVRQSITTAAMTDPDPAAVLRIANEVLLLQESHLVTIACGCVDLDTNKLTFATAGHPPMLLVPPRGSVQLLSTGGPPLGTMTNPPYRSSSVQVEAKSALVLYTDGLTENTRDTVAGERALIETVRAMDFRSDDPAAALLASVFSGAPPADDVAILTLTFLRAPKRSLRVMCA